MLFNLVFHIREFEEVSNSIIFDDFFIEFDDKGINIVLST